MDKETVKAAAQGRWAEIFSQLAPQLDAAITAAHTHRPHVQCPVCGKAAKFRLPLKGKTGSWEQTGCAICSCQGWRDGFALLQSLNGWTFGQAVNRVGEALGLGGGQLAPLDPTGARSWIGTAAEAGEFIRRPRNSHENPYKTWGLTLSVEDAEEWENASEQFVGNGIRKAWENSQCQVGDRVEVKYLGSRDTGKSFPLKVYLVNKLPSHQELEAQAKADAAAAQKQVDHLRSIWEQSERIDPSSDSPVVKAVCAYLRSRGIPVEKFAQEGWFGHMRAGRGKAEDGWHPCLISAVRDRNGWPVTLHRIFLTDEGRKAGIENPKRLMQLAPGATISGCAIRIGSPYDGVIAVAEGVETALSVVAGTGYPCWATINAPCMPSVELPESANVVLIFEDKDASGTGSKAAEELRANLAASGKVCIRMQIPDPIPEGAHGIDWNDIWCKPDGASRFPVKRPQASAVEREV